MHDAVLGPHQLEFVAGAGLGFQQHLMHRSGGKLERGQPIITQQHAGKEQS
ncbi:hypothetical protein D3C76_1814440 [compost metagenome]